LRPIEQLTNVRSSPRRPPDPVGYPPGRRFRDRRTAQLPCRDGCRSSPPRWWWSCAVGLQARSWGATRTIPPASGSTALP